MVVVHNRDHPGNLQNSLIKRTPKIALQDKDYILYTWLYNYYYYYYFLVSKGYSKIERLLHAKT